MKKLASLVLVILICVEFGLCQMTKEQIRAIRTMSPKMFALTAQEALKLNGYLCEVNEEKRYGQTKWDFVCNFSRAYDDTEIWGLLGAIVGAFYCTKYTMWSSDKVWIAVNKIKVSYLKTADCRRLYTYLESGELMKMMIELDKCLVVVYKKREGRIFPDIT